MSSLRSKLLLLQYGILLCSSFASLPVISSKRQTIRNAGSLVWASSSSWDKNQMTARDEEYLLGIKRLRKLYCNVGIGFHIQVLPNGKITGVHNENRYSKYFTIEWCKSCKSGKQLWYCIHKQLVYKFYPSVQLEHISKVVFQTLQCFYFHGKAKIKTWVTEERIWISAQLSP